MGRVPLILDLNKDLFCLASGAAGQGARLSQRHQASWGDSRALIQNDAELSLGYAVGSKFNFGKCKLSEPGRAIIGTGDGLHRTQIVCSRQRDVRDISWSS